MSITSEEYQELIGKKKKKSKYNSQITEVDAVKFHSKLEAKYYCQLNLRKKAQDLKYFLRQVPLHLPGKTKLVVDFMVVELDGSIRFIDTKGFMTPTAAIKIRQAQEIYPITVEIVKKC